MNSLICSNSDFYQYTITLLQCKFLEDMAQFLEPFKDLTKKISESNYSTIFLIIPLFNIIIDHIKDIENGEISLESAKILTSAMVTKEKLIAYYSKTNSMMMMYTALDSRRKFNYFTKKEFATSDINETKKL